MSNDSPPRDPTRRSFVKTIAVWMPTVVPITGTLSACGWRETPHAAEPTLRVPSFFKPDEAAFIDAATRRLIPADDLGAGAVEAGVPRFIDLQLGGAYGRAERWYMTGPWPHGTDQQGYQLHLSPAQFYRAAIADIDAYCGKKHGKPFAQLTEAQQDAVLHGLEDGSVKLEHVPSDAFFKMLWQNTQEGFLADPVYGGNRDFVGWKLVGFRGPRYNYVEEITQYGKPYRQPFVSLAGREPGTHPEGA
jgi:gluconate 2-dehydrogenase gamma chain